MGPDSLQFCAPENIARAPDGSETGSVIQVFIDYVDRNPSSRKGDSLHVFNRALAHKWPCPR